MRVRVERPTDAIDVHGGPNDTRKMSRGFLSHVYAWPLNARRIEPDGGATVVPAPRGYGPHWCRGNAPTKEDCD